MIKAETTQKTWGRATLTSAEKLEDCIAYYDFLPFFSNEVTGWSIEEKTPSRLWFTEEPGPWEWKGPIARQGNFLYGKFFEKKAGYIDRTVFGRFSQIRRSLPRSRNDKTLARELWLADFMSYGEAVLSPDLKEAWADEFGTTAGLDSALATLQMRTELVIADFEYRHDKEGKPYGWGLARYVKPEALIGEDFLAETAASPEDALEELVAGLVQKLPEADPAVLRRMIAGRR